MFFFMFPTIRDKATAMDTKERRKENKRERGGKKEKVDNSASSERAVAK